MSSKKCKFVIYQIKIKMKAIVIGATGLVGNLILEEVLSDDFFSEARIFVRKETGITNPKLKEIVSAMKDITTLSSEIQGDVLFNALGTTLKKAGSREEQQRIDRDLPISFARYASANGVKIMLNVSSTGASMNGGFYLKTKAEMENGTGEFFPGTVFHFRPGLLIGTRNEFRLMEKIAFGAMKIIDPILSGNYEKYRSMDANKLAKAMVSLSKNPAGKPGILHFSEIMQCL
jgi:uncharacterized protein YbjT (DUF2867 family)